MANQYREMKRQKLQEIHQNEPKYELTNETKIYNGITLYRIKALKNFADVKAGDLGGWVQGEQNLSQEGNCWIYDEAVAFQNSVVMENAKLKNKALVKGVVQIRDNAIIKDFAKIYFWAEVCGSAKVANNAVVTDNAKVFGNAQVIDEALIYGNATISENAIVGGYANVYGKAKISGSTYISNTISIFGEAVIKSNKDWFMVGSVGTDNEEVGTFFRDKDNDIIVDWGEDFYGTIENLKTNINDVTDDEREIKKINLSIQLAEIHING